VRGRGVPRRGEHTQHAVQLGHLVGGEVPAGGSGIGLDLFRSRRPSNHTAHRGMRQEPGKGQLHQRARAGCGKGFELLQYIEILRREDGFRTPGLDGQAGARRGGLTAPIFAGEKTTRQREVGENAHIEMGATGEEFVFNRALEHA
jgi:hypothetical protein